MALKIMKITAERYKNPQYLEVANRVLMTLDNGETLVSMMPLKDTKKLFDAWDSERQMEFDFVEGGA